VIAGTGGFRNTQAETAPAQLPQTAVAPAAVPTESPKAPASVAAVVKPKKQSKIEGKTTPQTVTEAEPVKEAQPAAQSIKVVMQIENGRVLKASIANPKPGMDSYEALALRIARQRRYPATQTGGETITINVNK
jgi:cytoskeletal protein RodZ